MDQTPDDRRSELRKDDAPPEEAGGGTASAQAEAILEESDERSEDRDAAPGTYVEHRTSDQASPPVD